MEYLDAFNDTKEFIGVFSRDEVHERGLWHNTVHCWLYDKEGNIYFQIRSDAHKLYTTASGHVLSGETKNAAFGREVKEEIGIDVDYDKAELLETVIWQMDSTKNGKLIKDRAFANIYLLAIENDKYDFSFTDGEVIGLAKLKARDVLDLFNNKTDSIIGFIIKNNNERNLKEITLNDFLLMSGETYLGKYGHVVEAITRK